MEKFLANEIVKNLENDQFFHHTIKTTELINDNDIMIKALITDTDILSSNELDKLTAIGRAFDLSYYLTISSVDGKVYFCLS